MDVVTLGQHRKSEKRDNARREYRMEVQRQEQEFRKREDAIKQREYNFRKAEIDKRRAMLKARGGRGGRQSLFFQGSKLGAISGNTKETLG